MSTAVDLSKLAPPDLVETISFAVLREDAETYLRSIYPALSEDLTADPIGKLLDVLAYKAMTIRQRINEAGRANMLAYSTGADLDHWGGNFNLPRLVVVEADPLQNPPVLEVLESDEDYRARLQSVWESVTNAGTAEAYRFFALSTSSQVKSAAVTRPNPGEVEVIILSATGNGTPTAALLNAVAVALDAETVRPLTDTVTVVAAAIFTYQVVAELVLGTGPDAGLVLQNAESAALQYVSERHAIGLGVPRSGIIAALHVEGVDSVNLISPAADVAITESQAAYANAVSVSEAAA